MSLNESIVEDAALIMPAATLTPALSQGERETYGEVVQSRVARTLIPAFSHGEKETREAIRRRNPANACGNPRLTFAFGYLRCAPVPTGRGEEAWATIRNFRMVRFSTRRRAKP